MFFLDSVAGALSPLIDPAFFVSSQVPNVAVHGLYETERTLAAVG